MDPAFEMVAEGRVITVSGELDALSAPQLSEAIEQMALEDGDDLRLELADVSFIDSTGLRVLLRAQQRCKLVLVSPSRSVERLLDLTGLNETFSIQ